MTLQLFSRPTNDRSRNRNRNRNHSTLVLESLEQRTVLNAAAIAPPTPAAHVAPPTAHAAHATLSVTGFNVNSVSLNSSNQLVANAVFTAKAGSQAVSIPATIPLTLTATPAVSSAATTAAAAPAVSVLHLTLGPVNLSLLGLNVHLGESCSSTETTPITADIVAIPTGSTYTSSINGVTYTGGLLGDVLSGVANLLNSGTGLGSLGSSLSGLESSLTSLLNGILAPASNASGTAGAHPAATPASPHTHEVLELPLGPVSLDLLGALVQTSPICLNITATQGRRRPARQPARLTRAGSIPRGGGSPRLPPPLPHHLTSPSQPHAVRPAPHP